MRIDPDALDSLQALLLGLAFAGLIASAFECATRRRASFALLAGGGREALLALPILAVSAPFILLRDALRVRRFERPRAGPVLVATVLAGLWALAAGEAMLGLAHQIAAA